MRHEYKITTTDPEELKSFLRGPDYHSCLSTLYNEFRHKQKYENGPTTWGDVYDYFLNVLNEYKVDPFE